jgi:hypothetical protein
VNKRTWPLIAVAFGVLIGAFVLSGIAVYRDYRRIYNDVQTVQRRYQASETLLNAVRSELYAMAILVRDYLLNSSLSVDRQERTELLAIRQSLLGHVGELEKTVDRDEQHRLQELRDIVQQYATLTDSIFEWTPEEKRVRSYGFLRREIVPFRNNVLKIASDIAQLNAADLQRRQGEIRALQQGAERFTLGTIKFASGRLAHEIVRGSIRVVQGGIGVRAWRTPPLIQQAGVGAGGGEKSDLAGVARSDRPTANRPEN